MNAVKPWKIILAFLLVFAAGVAAGMVLAKLQTRRAFEQGLQPETWTAEAMKKLDRELALTSEQRARILPLVEAGAGQIRDNLVRMATDSALLIDRLSDDIDRELTPEQRVAHGRMREAFREQMREALDMEFDRSSNSAIEK